MQRIQNYLLPPAFVVAGLVQRSPMTVYVGAMAMIGEGTLYCLARMKELQAPRKTVATMSQLMDEIKRELQITAEEAELAIRTYTSGQTSPTTERFTDEMKLQINAQRMYWTKSFSERKKDSELTTRETVLLTAELVSSTVLAYLYFPIQ